jgi:predicted Zn-dependent peptidase
VVLAPRAGEVACLDVSFRVGIMEEGVPLLTRLSQNALLHANATVRRDELMDLLFDSAAELRVTTGLRRSGFTVVAPRAVFDIVAARLLKLLFSPRLDVRRAEDVVQRTSVEGYGLDESERLNLLLAQVVAPDDGRFRAREGLSRGALVEVTQTDVPRFLRTALSAGNATVVLTGAIDPKVWQRRLSALRGGTWNQGKDRVKTTTRITRRLPARTETHLLAFPLSVQSPEAGAALRLVSAMLEDRVLQRFRQAGVGYTAEVRPVRTGWADFLMIVLPAHDESAIPLGPYLIGEVKRLRDALQPDELERNRAAVLRSLEDIDRDPELLAAELGAAEGQPAWYGREVVEQVRSIGPAVLHRHMAEWLTEQNSVYLLFSPGKPSPRDAQEMRRGWDE